MVLQDDADRVKHLLAEAISVLCKNGLTFESELSVEGLLGITLDNSDIFLVNISETIRTEGRKQQVKSATKSRVSAPQSPPQDRQSRKRSHDSQPTSPEPSAKRSSRSGRSSNAANLMDIKTEKLSVADDTSSYGGDDAGTGSLDDAQDMKCTRCGKMFDNPANLERHLKEIHFVGVVWLCCQNCDFSHVSMKHFNYHMFRLHRKVGGRKRFPEERKFLTPQRIKYRIEHNMRVPDISDNIPQSAAEKSGSSSTSLRRTPARLSASASRRQENRQTRTTDRSRVTIKTEPKPASGPRALRHRDGAGQVVVFSKNRKESLRRQSAPPAPKVTPKPAPKVTPKPITPKEEPRVTPKVKATAQREEKKTPKRDQKKVERKATPRREEKKATPRREDKKATPKREDTKRASLSKDKKKTPASNKKADKAVVKKKPIVSPKKVSAKKSTPKEQKPARRKSSSKKIIWPEGVSVKECQIKLNPLDLFAISAAGQEPSVGSVLEKSGDSPEKVTQEKSAVNVENQPKSPGSAGKTTETSEATDNQSEKNGAETTSTESPSAIPTALYANASLVIGSEKSKDADADKPENTSPEVRNEESGTMEKSSPSKPIEDGQKQAEESSEQIPAPSSEGSEKDKDDQIESSEQMEIEGASGDNLEKEKEKHADKEQEKDDIGEHGDEAEDPDTRDKEAVGHDDSKGRDSGDLDVEMKEAAEKDDDTEEKEKDDSFEHGTEIEHEYDDVKGRDSGDSNIEMEDAAAEDGGTEEKEKDDSFEHEHSDATGKGGGDSNVEMEEGAVERDSADAQKQSVGEEEKDVEREREDALDDDADVETQQIGESQDDTRTNHSTDDPLVSDYGDHEDTRSSPRAKYLSTALPVDQPEPTDQRAQQDIVAPRSPLMHQPVYQQETDVLHREQQQHTTGGQQSEFGGGDGEVDVSAILGEINTMNQ